VRSLAGWGTVDKFDRSNLDDAMTVHRVEPGCLDIDDDFVHAYTSTTA
jgi:hypothetical protein